jgi:hypothetical protein
VRRLVLSLSLALALAPSLPGVAQTVPRILGVERGGIYSHPVTPTVDDGGSGVALVLSLDGEPWLPGEPIAREGHHTLELRARDPGGPPFSPEPVVFAIDTTPPAIAFERPKGLPKGALPRVRVRDANPDPERLELFLDGQPYRRSDPVAPGKYHFEAVAVDRAGNLGRGAAMVKVGPCAPATFTELVPARTVLSAVHYFPWHSGSPECPARSYWCDCIRGAKPGALRPARGFYDSGSQEVVDAQLDQLAAHGVDVLAVEWFGEPTITANFVDRVLPALEARDLRFVLLYDLALRLGPGGRIDFDRRATRETFAADFAQFAASSSYFQHPKYLAFGHRPVVYLYVTRAIQGSRGRIKAAFDAAHRAAVRNGFAGLYLVADHLAFHPVDYGRLKDLRAGAATAFAPVTARERVPEDSAARPVRRWADKIAGLYRGALPKLPAAGQIDLQPGVFVQYDDADLRGAAYGARPAALTFRLRDGSDWSYMLQTAGLELAHVAERTAFDRRCAETATTSTDYASIVWTYSYNEWAEGSGLEELEARNAPYPFGFGLQPLQILFQKLR